MECIYSAISNKFQSEFAWCLLRRGAQKGDTPVWIACARGNIASVEVRRSSPTPLPNPHASSLTHLAQPDFHHLRRSWCRGAQTSSSRIRKARRPPG
eukprot:scaffold319166_cov24-Prasinocladus_malaysianus.AAC.1